MYCLTMVDDRLHCRENSQWRQHFDDLASSFYILLMFLMGGQVVCPEVSIWGKTL